MLSRLFYIFIFLLTTLYIFLNTISLYAKYMDVSRQQNERSWLYKECQQPEFSKNLAQYSDACEKVKLLFQKSPFVTLMDEMISKELDRNLMICIGTITVILCLVILTPCYLSFMEDRVRKRLDFTVFSCQDNIRARKAMYSDPIPLRRRYQQNV